MNLARNEHNIDRILRVVIGAALAIAGIAAGGVVAVLGVVVGLILIVTGTIGFCPIYRMLGLSTFKSE